jgi:hypothetical protein
MNMNPALQAVKMGIYDYVPKPYRTEDLEHTLLHRLRALGIPADPMGEAGSALTRELP